MPGNPCQEGLSAACFAAEPRYAKQALAYRLIHMFLPRQISKRLPAGLRHAFIGPGVQIAGAESLPPGLIVPPGTEWDTAWNPWLNFVAATSDQWDAWIMAGWTPGDPLPAGFTLPAGVTMPAGGFSSIAAMTTWLQNYLANLQKGGQDTQPPLYVQPWEGGPVSTAPRTPGVTLETQTFACFGTAKLLNNGAVWQTVRDAANASSWGTLAAQTEKFIQAYNNGTTYFIQRAAFAFNTGALPVGKTAKSAFITINVSSGDGTTCRMQATSAFTYVNAADYSKFTGAAFRDAPLTAGENTFTFNAAALALLDSIWGGNLYIMAREYGHDIANVEPPSGEDNVASIYTKFAADTTKRPLLSVTYEF